MSFSRNGNRSLPVALNNPFRKYPGGQALLITASCAAMAAVTGLLIYSVPSGLTWSETLFLAAPITGCLVLHGVTHRFMGVSCRAANNTGADQ
jgi:hypothetical protein